MVTKLKMNKNELKIDIRFLYNILFDENNLEHIYKYVNQVLEKEKIKFKGKNIFLYVNGIFLGTFYLTDYYFKKTIFNTKITTLTKGNSYYFPSKVLEISK